MKVLHPSIAMILLWLHLGQAWAQGQDHTGIYGSNPVALSLYFRKISAARVLHPTAGDEALSENVYHALFIWEGYHVERSQMLAVLNLDLHLDATILSVTSASRIDIGLWRNGEMVYTETIFDLPAGFTGAREIDIQSELDIIPAITFNKGDEIGFNFSRIDNLNPCLFRYNGGAGRDNSRLNLQLQNPEHGILEWNPADFDISLSQDASCDTFVELSNVGGLLLWFNLRLPDGGEILSYDDGGPSQRWSISNQYGRDLFNVRFTPAQDCTLRSARLLLAPENTVGSPDLMVYVWDDSSEFPGSKLDSVLVPHESLFFSPQWQVVVFAGKGLFFQGHEDFHIGYTCVSHELEDALGIYSDDGLPVGNERKSSGLWGQSWRSMYDQFDIDANFMIRAEVRYGGKPGWLSRGSYVPVIQPEYSQQIALHLDAAGLSDGIYRSGLIVDNDSPDPLLSVPITLRVGQTSVEGNEPEIPVGGLFLIGNYPNPFNGSTRITYQVGSSNLSGDLRQVVLAIYNIQGQLVRKLVDGSQPAGSYSIWWDGRNMAGVDVASGLYLCHLQMDMDHRVHKMLLLR